VPARTCASSRISASSPSLAAMLRALERPGMPHSMRYVGASACTAPRARASSLQRWGKVAARGDRKGPLDEGQIPNCRGVRVHVSTGYNV
jgi:hypothetical protein